MYLFWFAVLGCCVELIVTEDKDPERTASLIVLPPIILGYDELYVDTVPDQENKKRNETNERPYKSEDTGTGNNMEELNAISMSAKRMREAKAKAEWLAKHIDQMEYDTFPEVIDIRRRGYYYKNPFGNSRGYDSYDSKRQPPRFIIPNNKLFYKNLPKYVPTSRNKPFTNRYLRNSIPGDKDDSIYGGKHDSIYGRKHDSIYGGEHDSIYGGEHDSIHGGKHDSIHAGKHDSIHVGKRDFISDSIKHLIGGNRDTPIEYEKCPYCGKRFPRRSSRTRNKYSFG